MDQWRAWQDEIWWLGEIRFSKDTVDQKNQAEELHGKPLVGDLSPGSYLHII